MDMKICKNCLLCNKPLMKIKPTVKEIFPCVFEIGFPVFHPNCRKLNNKYMKLKDDLLNIEYSIFEKLNS